jgi:hypothetical protein
MPLRFYDYYHIKAYADCRCLIAASSSSAVISRPSNTTVPSISMAGNFGRDIRCIRPKDDFMTISTSKAYFFLSSVTTELMWFHHFPWGSLK